MRYKAAIAGYGVVGKKRQACIEANPHVELVAVCDQNLTPHIVLPGNIKTYSTYQEMFENESIDIVFVCMSNDMAAEVTIKALQKGAHVFCEKPPARNLEELALVLEAERAAPHLKLIYGFNHRYHYSVQDALKIVISGELGKVINARGVYGKSRLITYNQTDWRTKREIAGGGVLLDQGIHMVDLIRLFCGEFAEVKSYVRNDHWNYDVECNAYAIMKAEAENGPIAMLHSSATQWRHRFELEIALEKGALTLAGILSGSKSYGEETLKITWADDRGTGDPKEQITRYNHDPSWQSEVDYFVECIVANKKVTFGSSHDAFKTLELVYKIYSADEAWVKNHN